MHNTASHEQGKTSGAAMIGRFCVRVYALAVLLLIGWAGYAAVAYLCHAVFSPIHVPEHMQKWAAEIDAETLTDRDKATEAQSYPRAPLRHFHTLGGLFEPAPNTGCTISGCHGTLSHTKSKEVRAFANLHTTFMTCRMCHTAELANPTEAVWINADDGKRMETPALLELIRTLEVLAVQISESPEKFHEAIVDRLKQAVEAGHEDPILQYLLVQLETSEPGSPVWQQTIAQLQSELPNHARGEYGAMITVATTDEKEQAFRDHQAELAAKYFAAQPKSEAAEAIRKQIHEGVTTEPKGCTVCHGAEPPRLNFEDLGYSPSRSESLRSSVVAHMIEKVEQGQPFRMPSMLKTGIGQ